MKDVKDLFVFSEPNWSIYLCRQELHGDYSWVLTMRSKTVCCCPFFPLFGSSSREYEILFHICKTESKLPKAQRNSFLSVAS